MKVVELKQPNLMDVPASLRRLADQMDRGDVSKAVHAIVVTVDANGELACYGFGEVGDLAHEVGVLHLASMQMALME